MASKGRGYRTLIVEGFEVLIGRGDEENDRLTFEVAHRSDLWLHVAGGIAGSHVVVRRPEPKAEVPDGVLERAASLAAWYSKARNAAQVEVHVCRVSDVKKRRSAPTGEVHITNWKRLRVRPQKPDDG